MTPPARSPASSMPTQTARPSARRRASSRSPATRSKARGCCSTARPARSRDGLANSSGQVGRNYMRHMTGSVYAVFDKPVHMYRGTTMAGIIRDEARHDPSRGFVGGYEMETLSLGLPFMAAFLNPGAWGRRVHRGDGGLSAHGRHVARRRGHAAGDQPGHARPESQGQVRHAGRQRAFRRPSQRHRDARPRLQAGLGGLRGGRRDRDLSDRRPIPARTTWAPTA